MLPNSSMYSYEVCRRGDSYTVNKIYDMVETPQAVSAPPPPAVVPYRGQKRKILWESD